MVSDTPKALSICRYFSKPIASAIPDYRATPGNLSAEALHRIDGDVAHFLMVTQWESYEVIKAFAGEDISIAKYYDFDKDFLLEFEPHSYHYETYDS